MPLHQNILELSSMWERDRYSPAAFIGAVIGGNLLRLSQGISSECHHAPYTQNFCFYFGAVNCVGKIYIVRRHLCFDWYFVRVPPCPPYTLERSNLFWSRAWERDS